MGEPAGIGGELTLKAWCERSSHGVCYFSLDDPNRLTDMAQRLGLNVPIVPIETATEAISVFESALPVLPIPLASSVNYGEPNVANSAPVLTSIEEAARMALAGDVAAILTNPIQKKPLYDAGFRYQGHTDYLGALTATKEHPVMMLMVPGLRVVPVTVHIPVTDVPASLNAETIVTHGRVTASALKSDFGIERPRLVVAGLNPHAGESGSIGREEIEIIRPALEKLRLEGIDATGPFPSDSLFHAKAREGYDAVLCMYHDQALIPLKTLDFERGVNVTLGLPIVRTSPDHGTALDIAGTGRADIQSFVAALTTAASIARNRTR